MPLRALAAHVLFLLIATPLVAQDPDPEQAIDDFEAAFERAVRNWDVDAWSSLLGEEPVMMTPFGQTIEGREAFRAYWEKAWGGRVGSGPNQLSLERRGARVEGDLAVVRLAYGPEGGDPVGDYVWTLSRDDDGAWRLVWWIFTRQPPSRSS